MAHKEYDSLTVTSSLPSRSTMSPLPHSYNPKGSRHQKGAPSPTLRSLVRMLGMLSVVILAFASFLYGQEVEYQADNIELRPRKDQAILTGNASIRKKTQGLKANKIIMNNQSQIAQAYGNVTFLNKAQGIFYKGDYLKYDIEKEIIYAEGNPSIDNQKENIFIKSDSFIGYMKEDSITTDGNTRITIRKNATEATLITGKTSIYDLKEKNLEVETNVKILEQGGTSKDVGDNYVITCDRTFYLLINNQLTCHDNVKAENEEAQSIITSDYLLLEKSDNRGIARGNAQFLQVNEPNTLITRAEEMTLFRDEEKVILDGDVFITETNQKGEQLTSLNCKNATNYYGEANYLECYEQAVLSNFIKGSTITADFIYYNFTEEQGYAEKDPIMSIKNPDNTASRIHSLRIEIEQKEKVVYFKKEVYAYKVIDPEQLAILWNPTPASTPPLYKEAVTETITCKNAFYDYANKDNFVFECRGKVVMADKVEKTKLFSDKLEHRFDIDKSIAIGNVSFENLGNAPEKIIRGVSRRIIRDNKKQEIFFEDNVRVKEYNAQQQVTSLLTGENFTYFYQARKRYFEGFSNTRVEKPFENSVIRGDHMLYYIDRDYSLIKKNPLFINITEQQTKTLAYAKEMEIFLKTSITYMKTNVNLIEVHYDEPEEATFNLKSFKRQDYSYMSCEMGVYYYYDKDSSSTFDCKENVVLTDPANNMRARSEHLLHEFALERSTLTKKPQIEITSSNYFRIINADKIIMEQAYSQTLFNNSVVMKEYNKATTLLRNLYCDEAVYDFKDFNDRTLDCRDNVKMIDNEDNTEITGQRLNHNISNSYTYVTGEPVFTWDQETGLTVVKAEVLEKFDVENVMYAKGSVNVNNGKNEAISTLGIYEVEEKAITLYGSPKVKDLKTGDEFISEEVIFDLEGNAMQLQSDVSGSILLEDN